MAYSLPNVKPWVVSAANELGSKFGIGTVGGWNNTEVGKYGSRDHPLGLALDFMTRAGQPLADFAVSNAQRLGVTYVIWNRRIWNPTQGWKPYTGTSNPHTDHVHVSFRDTPPDGSVSGLSPAGAGTDTGIVAAVQKIGTSLGDLAGSAGKVGKFAEQITKLALPTNLTRAVTGVLGLGFVLVGIFFMLREVRG